MGGKKRDRLLEKTLIGCTSRSGAISVLEHTRKQQWNTECIFTDFSKIIPIVWPVVDVRASACKRAS